VHSDFLCGCSLLFLRASVVLLRSSPLAIAFSLSVRARLPPSLFLPPFVRSYLRSVWVMLMCAIWCPLTGIPAMLVILLTPFLGLSKCQRLCWRCSTIFFKIVLWSSGCPYTVEGLEQLDPDSNYFFAANHESLWDVPLIFAAMPFWLISIAKKSLRLVPVFGWAVAAGGTVWIDRKNHTADMESMKKAEDSLRKRPRSGLS